jgi:hypothetical protein
MKTARKKLKAEFRRGFAAGLADAPPAEHGETYMAAHDAGRRTFLTYWIAQLCAGAVEAEDAFAPLPVTVLQAAA